MGSQSVYSAVVVGYDGSAGAKRALQRAVASARSGAAITVVTAAPLIYQSPTAAAMVDPRDTDECRNLLEEAAALLARLGVRARTVEAAGDPAEALSDAARDLGADLIVVGTRGRNLAASLLLGSVSARIVREAPCDVLIVR